MILIICILALVCVLLFNIFRLLFKVCGKVLGFIFSALFYFIVFAIGCCVFDWLFSCSVPLGVVVLLLIIVAAVCTKKREA